MSEQSIHTGRIQEVMSGLVAKPEVLPVMRAEHSDMLALNAHNHRDAMFQLSAFVLGKLPLPRNAERLRDMLAAIDIEASLFLLNLTEVEVEKVPVGAIGE